MRASPRHPGPGRPTRLSPLLRAATLLASAATVAAAATATAGCSAEELFIGDRALDTCDGNWPVCSFRAGCTLDEREYLEGRFPGSRHFIVETPGRAVIRVTAMFFAQVSPGADTEVHWYEPGCFERYSYTSEGTDLFREAGNTGVLEKEHTVFREGDHLVEVFSDAVAEYLLKVDVVEPGDAPEP